MMISFPTDKESFSIGDVTRITGLPAHVVRYWESAVGAVRPARRGSGHRRFSRNDVETLVKVHELVRDKGYTLAGAKRFLRAELKRPPSQIPLALDDSSAAVALLKEVRSDLAGLVKELKTKIA